MPGDPPILVLYDGACPICSRRASAMRRRDRHDRLRLIDISAADFDPARFGLTHTAVQSQIHAVLGDGRIVTAMDALRHIHRALGMGRLLAPTGWPVLRPMCDWLYRRFAAVRPRLSGRGRKCATAPGESCNIRS
ncbi:MAG: thiol-disulfide oxidoreductase DCC family protein [Phycisphaerales bacterium]